MTGPLPVPAATQQTTSPGCQHWTEARKVSSSDAGKPFSVSVSVLSERTIWALLLSPFSSTTCAQGIGAVTGMNVVLVTKRRTAKYFEASAIMRSRRMPPHMARMNTCLLAAAGVVAVAKDWPAYTKPLLPSEAADRARYHCALTGIMMSLAAIAVVTSAVR